MFEQKYTVDIPPKTDLNNPDTPSRNGHTNTKTASDPQPDSGWPIPESLENPLPAVKKIEADMLPIPYRDWLTDIAHRMQVPLEFVATSAICLTGAIIGTQCTVRPKLNDDWIVVPNLWGAVVGNPGMLKTPSLNEVFVHLKKLEGDALTDFEVNKISTSVEKEMITAEIDGIKQRLKKHYSKPEDSKVNPDILKTRMKELLESAPEEPTVKRYKTNDTSTEKLADLLNSNPAGILVLRDEIMGLLMSFEKAGHEGARSFYLEGWDGSSSYTLDRIQRGTQFIKKVCLSVFGGIQPYKLASYLGQVLNGNNDGLIQRFQLLVFPDEPKRLEYVDRRPDSAARNKAKNVILKIAKADFLGEFGARSNCEGKDMPYLQFSPEAQEVFVEWYTNLQNRLLNDDLSPIMKEHLAKYRSLMPSLALIFHLINLADGYQDGKGISLEATRQAIKWCEVLETHAYRVYEGLGNLKDSAVINLSKKLRKNDLQNGFNARTIVQKGWSSLNKTNVVKKALNELEDAGWIRPKNEETKNGRPPSTTYDINPKIYEKGGVSTPTKPTEPLL